MPKYEGPNRRQRPRRAQGTNGRWSNLGGLDRFPIHRGIIRAEERRLTDSSAGHRIGNILGTASSYAEEVRGRPPASNLYSIVEEKVHSPRPERRFQGAGRRSGDLARALKSGEAVVYQVGKGILKSKTGTLKKVAKKAGPLGLALGVAGFAKEASAASKEFKTTGSYQGSKDILPAKIKVK